MRTASDIADWWDEQSRISRRELDAFVDEHPDWFGVLVAGVTATTMDLGAGMVDVLRLGEGAAEGGLKGLGKDGLRMLQFAPAAGRVGRFALARVLTDPGRGICTWIAATKALRQIGTKAFASVDDLARAAGLRSISQLGGAFVDELVPVLRRLGARVTLLNNPGSLEAVNAAVRGEGVVLFSVKWGQVGHTLYAFRNALGRVVYADRTGKVVSSLSELERFYSGISNAKVYGSAALLEGPRILITEGLAVLAMEVRAQLAVNPETAAQTLEVKKAFASGQPPAAVLAKGHWHTVQPGDWLSKIALRHYGDMTKWPVIYEANRKTVGDNPNLIHPGQRLFVPELPQANAKRR
jgi:LysM repeat protein